MLNTIVELARRNLPDGVRARLKKGYGLARSAYDLMAFKRRYLAETYVDLQAMNEFHAHKFPASGPLPWLDRPDAEAAIDEKLRAGTLTAEQAELCRQWHRDGYVILKRHFPASELDRAWESYDSKCRAGIIALEPEKAAEDDQLPGRKLNPHMQCDEFKAMWENRGLVELVNIFLGVDAAPFQTIASHKGSQQAAHSDAIHMTTYPRGYMCASWTAFEDIHADSGPLFYYPGSHRLPHYHAIDVGIGEGEFKQKLYAVYAEKYEPFIQKVVAERKLEPKIFLPAKGDVLLWHYNLLHGGSMRKDLKHSRRALVCHYYAKDAFCYHDLAGGKADERSSVYK